MRAVSAPSACSGGTCQKQQNFVPIRGLGCKKIVQQGARGAGVVPWGSRKVELPKDSRVWLENMATKGWTVPTWPKAYGGAGLDPAQYLILLEELRRINARSPLVGRGVNYIGPTILEFGTDEQKERWLPGMARGDGGWCMGYSEPGAGSDLASLGTKAVRDGDQYIINGRKIWTSDAVHGDYIFALVRTDDTAPKHDGISLILINMDQPGVQVRPIRLISGNSPFCETLFDDAMASVTDIIGPLNEGWTVGKRLLQYERSTHAGINISGTQGRVDEVPLPDTFRDLLPTDDVSGRILDNDQRAALLAWQLRQRAFELTQRRAIEEAQARAPGFTSSAVKLTEPYPSKPVTSCTCQHWASTASIGKMQRRQRQRLNIRAHGCTKSH